MLEPRMTPISKLWIFQLKARQKSRIQLQAKYPLLLKSVKSSNQLFTLNPQTTSASFSEDIDETKIVFLWNKLSVIYHMIIYA